MLGARCSAQQPPEEPSKDLLSLMLPDDDPFCPHLHEILSLNYDANELVIGPDQEVSFLCPLSFYDRHIASNLVLKRVCILPFLPDTLSTICEDTIRTFLAQGHKFPVTGYCGAWGVAPLPQVRESLSVYEYYDRKIGEALPQFPFILFMDPEHISWLSAFIFQRNSIHSPRDFLTEAGFQIARPECFPDFLKIKDEDSESVYKPLASTLREWASRYPNIAIWEFYSMSKVAKKLLGKMQAMASFKWKTSHTKGYSIIQPSRQRPLDATDGILMKAKVDEYAFTLRTRSKTKAKEIDHISSQTRSQNVRCSPVAILRAAKDLKPYKPQPTHFIQHVGPSLIV